jgi:hypothetical protein
MTNSFSDEIVHHISGGVMETNLDRSNQHLEAAVNLAKDWAKHGGGTQACVLGAEALKELALNALHPIQRTISWRDAIKALNWTDRTDPNKYAEAYASIAVDAFQDKLSNMDFAERQRYLRTAKQEIDLVVDDCLDDEARALLLSRKSSILRHQALNNPTEIRHKMFQESQRCATLATEINRNVATLLELATAEWALARHQDTDEKYIAKLRRAEELFINISSFELAKFALSRFYRLTYRFYDSCESFPRLSAESTNRRRLLRDSPIYAESAIQLVNLNFPEEILKHHLQESVSLLEMAITSGYLTPDVNSGRQTFFHAATCLIICLA